MQFTKLTTKYPSKRHEGEGVKITAIELFFCPSTSAFSNAPWVPRFVSSSIAFLSSSKIYPTLLFLNQKQLTNNHKHLTTNSSGLEHFPKTSLRTLSNF
jgi:hypothetical protein